MLFLIVELIRKNFINVLHFELFRPFIKTSPVVFNLDSNLWSHIEFNNVMFLVIIMPMLVMPVFGTIQLTSTLKFEKDEKIKRKQKVSYSK